jgi:hypothetical protein
VTPERIASEAIMLGFLSLIIGSAIAYVLLKFVRHSYYGMRISDVIATAIIIPLLWHLIDFFIEGGKAYMWIFITLPVSIIISFLSVIATEYIFTRLAGKVEGHAMSHMPYSTKSLIVFSAALLLIFRYGQIRIALELLPIYCFLAILMHSIEKNRELSLLQKGAVIISVIFPFSSIFISIGDVMVLFVVVIAVIIFLIESRKKYDPANDGTVQKKKPNK